MARAKVWILSGPKHSGKTTGLLSWCASKDPGVVQGFVTAVSKRGLKVMLDVETREEAVFEEEIANEDTLEVGTKPYYLSKRGFEFADGILAKALVLAASHAPDATCWFVVDEIGTLEVLHNAGHYELLSRLLAEWRGHAIIVVREQLCNDVIAKFDLGSTVEVIDVERLQTL